MPTPNPFSKPQEAAPLIKALVYGPSGIGKTWLALTFPGPIAVIDTEAGTAHYAGRTGLSPFEVISTKSYVEAKRAVDWLASGDHPYRTVVVDPVSVLYEVLQDTAITRRASQRGIGVLEADLEMLDWGRIKRQWKTLMTALVNLPLHVVCIARQKDETEKRGSEMVKVGVKFDAEKNTDYWFDVVLRMGKAREGDESSDGAIRAVIVEKDRTPAALTLGAVITDPSFDRLFGEYARTGKGTAQRLVADDMTVASADAEEETQTTGRPTPAQVAALEEAIAAAGQDAAAILAQQQARHPEWKSWSDVSATQVAALTERARKAAAKAAPDEPVPPPASGEGGSNVPGSPSPDPADAPPIEAESESMALVA